MLRKSMGKSFGNTYTNKKQKTNKMENGAKP